MSGWKNLSFTHKLIYVGIVSNITFIGCISLKRQFQLTERSKDRITWETELTKSAQQLVKDPSQEQYRCFFASRRYFKECVHDYNATQACANAIGILAECRQQIADMLPATTPCMRPLPEVFRE